MKQCVTCNGGVGPRHHAVECDTCHEWTHRRCTEPNVLLVDYRAAVATDADIHYICTVCVHMIPYREVAYEDHERHEELSTTVMETDDRERTFDSVVSGHMTTNEEDDDLSRSNLEIPVAESTRVAPTFADNEQSMDYTESASLHLPAVPLPPQLDESSIMETTDVMEDRVDVPEFTLVPGGTSRGKDLLVEAPGFSYTTRKKTATTRFWWCSVRQKGNRCPASVSERKGNYIRGANKHTHPEDPGCLINKQLSRKVKDIAAGNVFKSAMLIVEEQLHDVPPTAVDSVPKLDGLARKANRFRQNQRADDPRTMDFELAEDHIPDGFFQKDVMVDGARHVIFATPEQLQLLAGAKTWYLDGTFKVIRSTDVFDQLFGVHAFVKKDDCVKQVPLAFVFMTRRRKKDYKKVLKKLKNILPSEPCVTTFVLDFEAAVWKAIQSVFPEARVSGCAFHWTQAVWKRVQACGLSTAYNAGGDVQKVVRRLLALPLLPAQHIRPVFHDQREKASPNPELANVFTYVHDQWIDNAMWAPEDWSVYGQHIRTNNDCEGWHRRINSRTQTAPPFYALVNMLHQEARYVETQVKLVSTKKLTKRQRKGARANQAKIIATWCDYAEGGMSADKLLRTLARVYSK